MSKDDLNSVTDDVREKWMIVLVKSMIKYEAGCKIFAFDDAFILKSFFAIAVQMRRHQ